MRILKENNNILMGLLIGVTVPLLGYFCIETIFNLLTEQGIMDEVSMSSTGKRQRTMALVAICFNIIPLQVIRSRTFGSIIKGIVFATMLYAAFWVYYFKSSLFI
ncbi:MAG: hypothetical protein HKO66_13950 [Saprospiraceae bacterium]|nr:hypothetical protein [Saprospiraceae bacterium]NNL93339.1 hypothetical protein [Saprospiraceae bacterium]